MRTSSSGVIFDSYGLEGAFSLLDDQSGRISSARLSCKTTLPTK